MDSIIQTLLDELREDAEELRKKTDHGSLVVYLDRIDAAIEGYDDALRAIERESAGE